ncbi:hypothetical protein UFOVP219_36 [uncultured Caudovirales phage]|uniref:Uncharacterized protein n=1 Tax=uncultured Caudovirales phage TaxID=2100421 RepID=A0A6J7WP08_9CAUD|nr:hypothetical protein UFOVP219_36 [uncultured Caudovirales phage]
MANESVVFDVKPLLRDLEALEPGLKRQLVRDAKDVAKPIVSNIRHVIPSTAPLSGMAENGRLGWGVGKKADSVTTKFRSGRSRNTAITPLVSIWVNSPMTAIADIAGKGSFRKAKTVTREYKYKDSYRVHKVSSQGRWMVRRLRERGANDFIYTAVGDSIDDAQRKVKLVVDKYAAMVNRKLD